MFSLSQAPSPFIPFGLFLERNEVHSLQAVATDRNCSARTDPTVSMKCHPRVTGTGLWGKWLACFCTSGAIRIRPDTSDPTRLVERMHRNFTVLNTVLIFGLERRAMHKQLKSLARPEGFELPTPRFVVWRSAATLVWVDHPMLERVHSPFWPASQPAAPHLASVPSIHQQRHRPNMSRNVPPTHVHRRAQASLRSKASASTAAVEPQQASPRQNPHSAAAPPSRENRPCAIQR